MGPPSVGEGSIQFLFFDPAPHSPGLICPWLIITPAWSCFWTSLPHLCICIPLGDLSIPLTSFVSPHDIFSTYPSCGPVYARGLFTDTPIKGIRVLSWDLVCSFPFYLLKPSLSLSFHPASLGFTLPTTPYLPPSCAPPPSPHHGEAREQGRRAAGGFELGPAEVEAAPAECPQRVLTGPHEVQVAAVHEFSVCG